MQDNRSKFTISIDGRDAVQSSRLVIRRFGKELILHQDISEKIWGNIVAASNNPYQDFKSPEDFQNSEDELRKRRKKSQD